MPEIVITSSVIDVVHAKEPAEPTTGVGAAREERCYNEL